MCRFINNLFPANDILLITIYIAIKKCMHAECICNKLFQYLVTRSDYPNSAIYLSFREESQADLNSEKPGSSTPGPGLP